MAAKSKGRQALGAIKGAKPRDPPKPQRRLASNIIVLVGFGKQQKGHPNFHHM